MVEITSAEICQMTWVFHSKFSQTQGSSLTGFSGLRPFCAAPFQRLVRIHPWRHKTLAGWSSQHVHIYHAVITLSDSFFMLNPALRVFRYNNSSLFSAVEVVHTIDPTLKNITQTLPVSPAQSLREIKASVWVLGNVSSLQGNTSKIKAPSSTNNQRNPNVSSKWNGKVRCC